MKRKCCLLLALVLCACLCLPVSALDVQDFVLDDADIITDTEEVLLQYKLAEVSQKYNTQILVGTIDTLENVDLEFFIGYIYDVKEFGYGEYRDGVLLMLCMDIREFRILSNGNAAIAITTEDIADIAEEITPYLSEGSYAEAFTVYADECAQYLELYQNGPVFNTKKALIIAVIVGLVIGIAVAVGLRQQLKSVRKQVRADTYVKPGSMQLTLQNDRYLYRNVSRVKRQTSSSSSSGSRSSSRSIGGGKF